MGYGWAVVQGARMAAQGAEPQAVADAIQDWVDHVTTLRSPRTLERILDSPSVKVIMGFSPTR